MNYNGEARINDTVTVYKDVAGLWRWRRTAANGKELSKSSQGYTHRMDCYTIAAMLNDEATLVIETPADEATTSP